MGRHCSGKKQQSLRVQQSQEEIEVYGGLAETSQGVEILFRQGLTIRETIGKVCYFSNKGTLTVNMNFGQSYGESDPLQTSLLRRRSVLDQVRTLRALVHPMQKVTLKSQLGLIIAGTGTLQAFSVGSLVAPVAPPGSLGGEEWKSTSSRDAASSTPCLLFLDNISVVPWACPPFTPQP